MSIKEEIWHRISEGRLVELRPRIRPPAGCPRRQLYLDQRLFDEIVAERDDLDLMDRFAELEADLAQFITSPTLHDGYIKQLSPSRDVVWEIRSVEPEPQLRVFGLFAAKNVFVATHYEDRNHLGSFESQAWREEKRRARTIWNQLFNAYHPFDAEDIHGLLDGAIDGKYFRD